MKVTPNALLDDGKLDIMILKAMSKFDLVKTFPKVFRGAHLDHPAVQMLRGRRIEVAAERTMQVFGDGDHIGTLPATFEVLDGAIRVVVPPGGGGRFSRPTDSATGSA
jgi:diacylglycerol kinase (ATP)